MTEPIPQASPLSVDKLRKNVASGHVDTVLVVFTDVQGRLQGQRIHAQYFLDETLEHGSGARTSLLAVDVDMQPADGHAMTSWENGYGDVLLRPDLWTLRAVPWQPSTAMVQCDVLWLDGTPVNPSPRQVLARQVDAAAAMGLSALASTELQFMVFEATYEAAWDGAYRGLTPSYRYSVEQSILGTSRVEPLLRDIRNAMHGAGLVVESAQGARGHGQYEVTFKSAEVMRTADEHSVYKTAAKEIAVRHGKALTFMSKVNQREGNACRILMSLRGLDGSIVFEPTDPLSGASAGRSEAFECFMAGVLATVREFTLLYAPNINSYKRLQPGSPAPTAIAWSQDDSACALRVVGRGAGLRVENRVPGGDANPYMATAAMLAGGLWGLRTRLPLEPAFAGHADTAHRAQVPATLREARDLFSGSVLARDLFGDDVVDHYVAAADVEIAAFASVVTDWELFRGFERL